MLYEGLSSAPNIAELFPGMKISMRYKCTSAVFTGYSSILAADFHENLKVLLASTIAKSLYVRIFTGVRIS